MQRSSKECKGHGGYSGHGYIAVISGSIEVTEDIVVISGSSYIGHGGYSGHIR